MRTARFLLGLGVLGVAAAGSFCGSDDGGGAAAAGPYDKVAVTGQTTISGLQGPVDVVRDTYGMVHIHAKTTLDAMRVEGYQVARDRTAQLELIRRTATGRMAEVFGDTAPSLIDSDIAMRTVGLARAAKDMLDQMAPEVRADIDAYADGISQFNARILSGDEDLPAGMIGLSQQAFQPWTAVDVLAVARYQALNLAYTADDEIALTKVVEAARAKLTPGAADPALAKRAGFLVDTVKFAPIEPATPLDGFPNDVSNTMSNKTSTATAAPTSSGAPAATPKVRAFRASPAALAATDAFRAAITAARGRIGGAKIGLTGSNNWIVAPSRAANGHALLASDPHLGLSSPSTFWMVQVTVDGQKPEDQGDFAGLAFPGLPGIILGFNKNIAWGATTADFDVTDVYEETLTPDASGVVFRGQNVPFEKVHETIAIAGKAPLEYDVLVVPHHGPIVPTITADHGVAAPSGGKALSVRWTGHKASKDVEAIFGLFHAKNVDDARAAMQSYGVGAQNWVFADTQGNIFYTTHASIPKRDKGAYTWDPKTFTGTIPSLVLPGDGSAEWTGSYLEDAYIPHQKNPAKGWLATANTDQVGGTLDNDPTNDVLPSGEPMYMASWHDPGFRLARIQQRIEGAGHPLTLDDLAQIQADARSATGAKLAPQIVAAIGHALEEQATPGTHPDLTALSPRIASANLAEIQDLLTRWGAEADYDAASGMNPDDNTPSADAKEAMASRATTVFNVWLSRMIHLVFDDEAAITGGTEATRESRDDRRVLMNVMLPDPKTLATYDATYGDSILFDDLTTPELETRDERIVHSLLDALDFLGTRLGADRQAWQWGRIHTIRFTALVSLWKSLSIPQDPDAVFPIGFPRHGDGYNVDVAQYTTPATLDETASFSYSHGPTQRLVIEMDPNGPIARNALPGGNVWDSRDPHFRDEAERWRRNQNRPVPFATADVVAAAESRTVYSSK
jgi:penicillin amidase